MHAKIGSFVFFVFACVGTCHVVADENAKLDPGLSKLRGHWKSVTWVISGREENKYRKRNLTHVSGTTLTFFLDGKKQGTGTIRVDTTKTPHHIDLTYNGGPMEGKTLLGIYKFDGDRYVNCYAQAGDARPKEFKSTPENRYFLSVDQKTGASGEPSDAPESSKAPSPINAVPLGPGDR